MIDPLPARRPLQPDASTLRVTIVGAGVVGHATGVGLAATGCDVRFADTSPSKVRELVDQGLVATAVEAIGREPSDFYLLSVPTPTVADRPDLTHVRAAAAAVGEALRRAGQWACVVVRSTVPPGTTENEVLPLLEAHSGATAGIDFSVAVNPEFLRAVSAYDDFLNPRVIVLGVADEQAEQALRVLYAPWADVPQHVMPLRTAESAKYVANLFNATKISFFNELHRILSSLEVDSSVAIAAATAGAEGLWNPPYGTRGGAPFGGACLPKDLAGFIGMLADLGIERPLLDAVQRVNDDLRDPATPDAAMVDTGESSEVCL